MPKTNQKTKSAASLQKQLAQLQKEVERLTSALGGETKKRGRPKSEGPTPSQIRSQQQRERYLALRGNTEAVVAGWELGGIFAHRPNLRASAVKRITTALNWHEKSGGQQYPDYDAFIANLQEALAKGQDETLLMRGTSDVLAPIGELYQKLA